MKSFVFRFNFTEIRSKGSNLLLVNAGSGNGLVPNRQQTVIWTSADLVQWRINAAQGGDELRQNATANVLNVHKIFSERVTEGVDLTRFFSVY